MLARESLALLSLVALATASVVPVEVRRDYPPPDLVVRDAATTYTSDLAKRFDKNHTYDLSWSAQDQTIFSGLVTISPQPLFSPVRVCVCVCKSPPPDAERP